jgi:hypothetical protein
MREPLLARVDGDKVKIGDVAVTSDELGAELERRGDGVTTLAVELAAGYDDDALGRLLAAADLANIKQVVLRKDGRVITTALNAARDKRLVVWNRGGRWRLYDLDAGSAAAGTFEAVEIDDAKSEHELRDRLSAIVIGAGVRGGTPQAS